MVVQHGCIVYYMLLQSRLLDSCTTAESQGSFIGATTAQDPLLLMLLFALISPLSRIIGD